MPIFVNDSQNKVVGHITKGIAKSYLKNSTTKEIIQDEATDALLFFANVISGGLSHRIC